MKKLLMLCALVMVFSVSLAQAQQYEVTLAGDPGNYITNVGVAPGGTIAIDVYLTGAAATEASGGLWLDFSASVADIAYVSAGRCMVSGGEGCVGPWTDNFGVVVNQPAGVGTLLIQVANLGGAATDAGTIIVGTVTLENTGSNDATVNITTIPSAITWGNPTPDASITPGVLVVQEEQLCPGGAGDCDDGNECTDDTCPAGVCVFVPVADDTPCDDGDACTVDDVCTSAVCGGGSAVVCNDDNACTADTCDPATGCVFTPIGEGDPCDDDDACTEGETCSGGVCGTGSAVDCDDANECTDDSCDSGSGCIYDNVANGTVCDDGDACTESDECTDGACGGSAVDCDDSDLCTTDSCDPGDGSCINAPVDCSDGDLCTEDVCDPGDGSCSNPDVDCSDADLCTEDVCDPGDGSCSNPDVDCSDGNECTQNVCDPGDGSCSNPQEADGTTCDDGVFCNGDDTCSTGECTDHAGDPCSPGETCSEGSGGRCIAPDCTSNAGCDDGIFCNGPEVCQNFTCQDGTPPCEPPLLCDEDGGACVDCFEAADCDDGVFCNGAETCDPQAGCRPGSAPCTDDGDFCNGDESCDEGADQCVSSGDPCAEDENCIEETDTCEDAISIDATFSGCGIPFGLWFGVVGIQGTGTDFGLLSIVDYDSPLVLKLLKFPNNSTQTITQIVWLLPSLFFPAWDYPATVTVTVDGLSDTIEIPTCLQ